MRTRSGTTAYTLYDGDTPVCALDSSGTVTQTFTLGPTGLANLHLTTGGAGEFINDPRGNTVATVNASGSIYNLSGIDAFGETGSSAAGPFDYQHTYPTEQFGSGPNATALSFREYDPSTGRMLKRDPMGYGGGINLYGYTQNNPVNDIDPLGLDAQSDADIINEYTAIGGLLGSIGGGGLGGGAGLAVGGVGAIPGEIAGQAVGGAVGGGLGYMAGQAAVGIMHMINGGGGAGIENRGGSFGDLDDQKGPNEVAHHMPQNRFLKLIGKSRRKGPALGMDVNDHLLTRTWCGRGIKAMRLDAKLSGKARMLKDIKDVRKLFPRKYNKGISEMIQYARTLTWL